MHAVRTLARAALLLPALLVLFVPCTAQAGDDCSVTRLEAEDGAVPIRVSCETPFDAEQLFRVVSEPSSLVAAVGSLGEGTRVLADRGSHLLVLQVHESKAIADRWVAVEWRVRRSESGRTC